MKTVIVTGASRGIGAAIARSLRVQGVRVVGVARSTDILKALSMEKIGSAPFEFVAGDIADTACLRSAVDLASRGNELVGLVLNAAQLDPFSRVAQFDSAELMRHYTINVWSQQVLTSLCIPHLRATRGKIVFVTSGIVEHPMVGWSAYAAGKAAMNSFIGSLAKEEPHITALSVKPGIVDTAMVQQSATSPGVMDSQGEQWIRNLQKSKGLLDPKIPGEAIAKIVLRAPPSCSGNNYAFNDKLFSSL